MHRRDVVAAILGVALLVTGCESGSASVGPAAEPSVGDAHPTKVLVVVEENHTQAAALRDMTYLASLANAHGQTTNYRAVAHPSLPNYLAIAGGSTFGVTDDKEPVDHPLSGPSVFDSALLAGATAKTYAEAMPYPCAATSRGGYAARHNAWTYFADPSSRSNCQKYDVPSGTPASGALREDIDAGRLPTLGMLIPDLCHDGHDCELSSADEWLSQWSPAVMAGPDYRAGRLAIVVTFDEDDESGPNTVLTVVVAPQISRISSATSFTHYSLARYLGELSGAAPLRDARAAPSLRAAFPI